jgi:hypothetical protein
MGVHKDCPDKCSAKMSGDTLSIESAKLLYTAWDDIHFWFKNMQDKCDKIRFDVCTNRCESVNSIRIKYSDKR